MWFWTFIHIYKWFQYSSTYTKNNSTFTTSHVCNHRVECISKRNNQHIIGVKQYKQIDYIDTDTASPLSSCTAHWYIIEVLRSILRLRPAVIQHFFSVKTAKWDRSWTSGYWESESFDTGHFFFEQNIKI